MPQIPANKKHSAVGNGREKTYTKGGLAATNNPLYLKIKERSRKEGVDTSESNKGNYKVAEKLLAQVISVRRES